MKNTSNILAPLNRISSIDALADAGTDEFYVGFFDERWSVKFGEYAEINRMSGFGKKANPFSFDDLPGIIQKVKAITKKVFVTINSSYYSEEQMIMLREYLSVLKKAEVDGVIISTPALALMAIEQGLNPVGSTMCNIVNSDIVDFYRSLGMRRMILPRDLSLSEIETIVTNNPDIEFEVFLMRNGCQFSDSSCLGFHRKKGSICGMLNNAHSHINTEYSDFKSKHDIELNHLLYSSYFHKHMTCGLCALYRFVQAGISAYKIVGRSEVPDGIIEDVKIVNENLQIAYQSNSEKEYLSSMIIPHEQNKSCVLGLNCYYPEVRF